jgi:uncharacterized protein YceK
MTYYGYYPPPPPEANRREKKARYVALGYVGLVVLVVVGVAVYVMLQRLETDVLTAIATIGCASVITLANPDPGADGLPAGAGPPGQRPGQRRDDDPAPGGGHPADAGPDPAASAPGPGRADDPGGDRQAPALHRCGGGVMPGWQMYCTGPLHLLLLLLFIFAKLNTRTEGENGDRCPVNVCTSVVDNCKNADHPDCITTRA